MKTPACLSDLRIDMWLAGDLDGAAQASARAHVAGCAHCARRLADIETARAADARDLNVSMSLDQLRRAAAAPEGPGLPKLTAPWRRSRARWRGFWEPLVGAMAAAAAVAVLVVRTGQPPTGGTRVKGGAHIGLYVDHGGSVRRGGPDEPVNPGDRVRFTTSTDQPAHLAIISVDAIPSATIYFPIDGASDAVPAGHDLALPRATVLDDTLGVETLYAFFCPDRIDAAALEAARSALLARPHDPPLLAGCTRDDLRLIKVKARAP